MESLENKIESQVSARRRIIADAREQLRLLRSPRLEYATDTDSYEPVMDYDCEIQWTDKDVKASADLLRLISEQEKAIEELLGLYAPKGKPNVLPPSNDSVNIKKAVVIVGRRNLDEEIQLDDTERQLN